VRFILKWEKIKMNKTQNMMGAALALATLVLGSTLLKTDMLFFRLLIGVGLGYVLTRGFMGFAGSVNRAYNGGTTKLMQVLMFMFVMTAILNAGFLIFEVEPEFGLWINPINLGLAIGGIMFGFGMTFASCCASGVMTDLVTDLPRAAVTLFFFGMGIFLGFPLQRGPEGLSIIQDSMFETSSYYGQLNIGHGVYMPDLFGTGLMSYVGAILLTCLFAGIVIYFSKKYENKRKAEGTFYSIDTEIEQEKAAKQKLENEAKPFKLLSQETYNALFVTPWSMKTASLMIVVLFGLMLAATKMGWGASTPFGLWFGKILIACGVSLEWVTNFTHFPAGGFLIPFFNHDISVQNFGIVVGTAICVLLMGKASFSFNYSAKQLALFAMGGFFMGMGTRFSNGCNVGALYTPIANLSLSGWVFLVFLIAGGILGNRVAKMCTTKNGCSAK
jgi:uncharacterized membrane protein YedE/YeeE